MKYFLIVYNRATGQSEIRQTFDASHRSAAMKRRFEAENEFSTRPEIEIVVLGAESENGLMRTHARYFSSTRDMLQSVQAATV